MSNNVHLPPVTTFLLLFSLKCGTVTILLWTLFRAIFCLTFFIWGSMMLFLRHPPPVGGLFPKKPMPLPTNHHFYIAYALYLSLIITEAILIVFSGFFVLGLSTNCQEKVRQYLVGRFFCWFLEVIFLASVSVVHFGFIGWYLIFLMFVILELYGFIVVVSYYNKMKYEEKLKQYHKTFRIPYPYSKN